MLMDAGFLCCNADRTGGTLRGIINILRVEEKYRYQYKSGKTVCMSISTQEDTDTEHIYSELKRRLACQLMYTIYSYNMGQCNSCK
jgi:hypothetical protein